MSPRTIDVPELSTIEPTETLRDWRKRTCPRRPNVRTRIARALAFTFNAYRN